MTAHAPFDVVVPVQDVDRYLEAALESVSAQTVVPASVVVVDAGSWEPVRLPAGAPAGWRLVRRDERLPASAARNVGAARGSARYVSFLDADDLWPPGRTECLLTLAEERGADWAYGVVECFAEPEALGRLRVPGPAPGLLPGAGLYRRSSFESVGGFDASLVNGEVVDLASRLWKSGARTAAVDEVTLRRRIHLESMSVRARHTRSAYLSAVRTHLSRMADDPGHAG